MKRFAITVFCLTFALSCDAKYWGGYIGANNISGFDYEVSMTTFVIPGSASDAEAVIVDFGDGILDTLFRTNGGGIGVLLDWNIRKNVYSGIHTYPGVGIYKISSHAPYRAAGIMNITNSVNCDFYIESRLFVQNTSTHCATNGFEFERPPILNLYAGSFYKSDLPIVKTEGDSLSYSLTTCKDAAGATVAGYFIPSGFVINNITGQLTWSSPTPAFGGIWNFAVKVEKWRKGILAGDVLFDFILTVKSGTYTPFYFGSSPVCTVDIDSNHWCSVAPLSNIDIAVWCPLSNLETYSEINYLLNTPIITSTSDTVHFSWTPTSSESREQPYKITFRGSNVQGPDTVFRDYTYFITVTGAVSDICAVPPNLVSVESNSIAPNLQVYPNPNAGSFTVSGLAGEYSIVNSLGQRVKTIELSAGNTNTIVIDDLNKGVYYIISNERQVIQSKIVVLR
jgi:hypothetical protein